MENIKLSQEQESEGGGELQKFEGPIREFLVGYFAGARDNYDTVDVQFDGGNSEDWKKLQSGDYEITELAATPDGRGAESAFHFNVGKLKIHLTGKAASKVYESLDGK